MTHHFRIHLNLFSRMQFLYVFCCLFIFNCCKIKWKMYYNWHLSCMNMTINYKICLNCIYSLYFPIWLKFYYFTTFLPFLPCIRVLFGVNICKVTFVPVKNVTEEQIYFVKPKLLVWRRREWRIRKLFHF